MSTRVTYLGQEMTLVQSGRSYLVYVVIQGCLIKLGAANSYSQAVSLGRQEIDAWNRQVNKVG